MPRGSRPPEGGAPWYRRRSVAVAALLVVVAGLGFGAFLLLSSSEPSRPAPPDPKARAAVDRFDRAALPLDAALGDVALEMRQEAEAFDGGRLSGEALRARCDQWERTLREVLADFTGLPTPERLQESRALFAYGTSVLINSVEPLRLATFASEADARAKALQLNLDMLTNGFDVVNMAKRALEKEKARLRLGNSTTRGLFIKDPIPLPGVTPAPKTPGRP